MGGAERSKYCAQCGHHVANLSLLSATERSALLARARTEQVCGSYLVRLSGEMVTPEAPLSHAAQLGVKQFGVAALSAAALAIAAGCMSPPATRQEPAVAQVDCVQISEPDPVASPGSLEKKIDKKGDEEVILLMGFIVCDPKPVHKPGRTGK